MRKHELDDIDLRILTALQRSARISNVELSEITQVTAPTTLRRKQTLEENGIIRGYHAELDAKKLGFEVLAFVSVSGVSTCGTDWAS